MTKKTTDIEVVSARRADAKQNRERILTAARAAFEAGADMSMHTVARLAGVGQGTLYRNFPNLEALILALHRQDVQSFVDNASKLTARHPPAIALRRWVHDFVDFAQVDTGLSRALRGFTCGDLRDAGYQSFVDTIGLLVKRAQESGDIREDIDGEDLLLLIGFAWTLHDDPASKDRSKRLLDIVLGSLSLAKDVSPLFESEVSGPAPDGVAV